MGVVDNRNPAADHSRRRLPPIALLSVAIASLAIARCGGAPAAPTETSAANQALRIVADPVVTMTQGESRTLTLEERDAAGRFIPQAADRYTWTSSDPGVVSAGAGGVLTAGTGLGEAIVTARSAGGLTSTARVWVQQSASVPSTFKITLVYADDVSQDWRDHLEAAAARWQEVIRAELPAAPLTPLGRSCDGGETPPPPMAGLERGTRIFVSTSGTFPDTDEAEAIAALCLQRPLPHPTAIFGRIILNRKKHAVGPARKKYLALHEMGHVLALVGNGLGRETSWFDSATGRHTGPFALEGYRLVVGYPAAFLGVSGSHWDFGWDVMGSTAIGTRISRATVGALMDLGYPAAWYGADD
jgi:hypothetical protein